MRALQLKQKRSRFPSWHPVCRSRWSKLVRLFGTPISKRLKHAASRSQKLWLRTVGWSDIAECSPADRLAETIQARLKDLKNDVRDSIDECQDFEDDPESFDQTTFMAIKQQADKCSADCVSIFRDLRDQLTQGRVPTYMLGKEPKDDTAQSTSTRVDTKHSQSKPVTDFQTFTLGNQPKDDRIQLSSMRHPSVTNSMPPPYISPATPTEPLRINTPSVPAPQFEPVRPKGPWGIGDPLNYDMSPILGGSLGASASLLRRKPVGEGSPAEQSDGPPLIPKEIVHSRINANEEFLERRRQSRIMFNNELRYSAVSSIDENRASETFSDGPLSPLIPSPATSTSPVDGRGFRASLNTYDMTRQRSQGHASQGTRSSRTSSVLPDRQPVQRRDSEDSIFGLRGAAPASPSISENQTVGTSGNIELWSPITTTASPAVIDNPYTWDPVPVPTKLQMPSPSFGNEIPAGLEPVNVAYDDGMIVVNAPEQNAQRGPTFTVRKMDYPIRADSSFTKFGGFCDGAKALTRGETGFKIAKRPSVCSISVNDMANQLTVYPRATIAQLFRPDVSLVLMKWAGMTLRKTKCLTVRSSIVVRNSC
jgi:hypothetical protein